MKVEEVFKQGPLHTDILTVSEGDDNRSPPKPLQLVVPSLQGNYPVLLFLHGFYLNNNYYTQLLQHVASHGYITVAPQMNSSLCVADATGEIEDTVAVTEWLRGGKVAFGAVLGRTSLPPLPCAALLGIDPVDGTGRNKQTPPPILTYEDHSFPGNTPTLVIGSGLGSKKANFFVPACAPAGVNHVDFFAECCAPAYHFVAKEYGHMDLLNDELEGVMGKLVDRLIQFACKHGTAREPMRSFTGGIMVAFLKAYLNKETEILEELVAKPSIIPVTVETPERYLDKICV
ncbi:hypothetical protein SUGI_1148450 [Cryptomeria japonica]|nr:hypothetical protein SUGI_1148450 [Cryptomeria japonica]